MEKTKPNKNKTNSSPQRKKKTQTTSTKKTTQNQTVIQTVGVHKTKRAAHSIEIEAGSVLYTTFKPAY